MNLRAVCFFLAFLLMTACSEPSEQPLNESAAVENNRAVGFMRYFDYASAHTILTELAGQYPDNHDITVNLAISIFNQQREGDAAAAIELLDAVIAAEPEHLRAWYCRGILALHAGLAAEAEPYFRKVVEADPDDAYAAYYLAQSLAQQQQHAAALERYQRAIELDPLLRSAYYGAFQSLRLLGEIDRAQAFLNDYQRLENNPQARLAEFKYTRMGPKSEALVLDVPTAVAAGETKPPEGPVFQTARPLPDGPQWRQHTALPSANITVADINGDGLPDIFAAQALAAPERPNGVFLGQADGTFQWQAEHPLAAVTDVNAALWGDIDNDGRMDVYLCRHGDNQLWQQDDTGWHEISQRSGSSNGPMNTVDGALFDADHDGDLDVFLVNADGPNELLNNNADGSFRPLAAEFGLAGTGSGSGSGSGRQVITADLDNDRDIDLLVINAEGSNEVYINDRMWQYQPAQNMDNLQQTPLFAAVAADTDADGWVEIYGSSPQGIIYRWSRTADGQWQRSTLAEFAAPTKLAVLDSNGDARPDLWLATDTSWEIFSLADELTPLYSAGEAVVNWQPAILGLNGPSLLGMHADQGLLLWSPGSGRYPFATLTFSGLDDKALAMRSNAAGIGTYYAARAGSQWTAGHYFRADSGPGQSHQAVAIGLKTAQQIDFVNIDWPDGVSQSELDLSAGGLHSLTEQQRQLASCPVLFAWNGDTFAFVTDMLGVSALGSAVGYQQYSTPRAWEAIQVSGQHVIEQNGHYVFKLTEPMEETAYVDAVSLHVYDLPPAWHMVLDERLHTSEPVPTGDAIFYRHEVLPAQAMNQDGQDVTATLLTQDLQAAPVGALDRRFIGRLDHQHSLTLTFADALDQPDGQAWLMVDGWLEYPYSQTMFAAWQAGADYQSPSLEAWVDGRWQPVLEHFGFPAGMPKRMSVPLTNLPPGVTRLRLSTNMQIYWDRLAIIYAEPAPAEVTVEQLPLQIARVESVGFPQRNRNAQGALDFDFDQRIPLWDTKYMKGFYTAYGPATELVTQRDDALAIFGNGDGLHMAFAAPGRAVPENGTRTLVLRVDGWVKDRDLYTRQGETIAPLPSTGHASAESALWHERYNTRYQSGR